MTTTTTLAPRAPAELTLEQISLVKDMYCRGANNNELQLFVHACNRLGLDPFLKQIYAIKRGGLMTIQVGVDGYRLVAQRTGEYEGQTATAWCGEDGVWRDVWLDRKPPAAARVGVYRRGFRRPIIAVARWHSYASLGNNGAPQNLWAKMPEVMLAKCAECLALRKAFPSELSGTYGEEEMSQADNGRGESFSPHAAQVAFEDREPVPVFNGGNGASPKPAKAVKKTARRESPPRPAATPPNQLESTLEASVQQAAQPALHAVQSDYDAREMASREEVPPGYSPLYADVAHILCLAELHSSPADLAHVAALIDGLDEPGERRHANEMYRRVRTAIMTADAQKKGAAVRQGLVAKLHGTRPA